MEVIIVNNCQDDQTIKEVKKRFSRFMFIQNNVNGGFANGCNLGAENSLGEFLLFLNPDTVATESEIEKLLIAARSDSSNYILSCRQVRENSRESKVTADFPEMWNLTGFLRLITGWRNMIYSKDRRVLFPDCVSGSVIMIRREIFFKVKGFDEDFWMYLEDTDLCRRIRNTGAKIAYYRDIEIMHAHGGSSRIDLKTISITKCEVMISKHVYIQKHKTGADRTFIQAFMVVNNLLTGLILGLSGIILFFIPALLVRTWIFLRLLNYYTGSFFRHSWISPRSVNFKIDR